MKNDSSPNAHSRVTGIHPRLIGRRLQRLAKQFPVVVIAGARQTGKTTLCLDLFGQVAELVVFDPVTDIGDARRDPELFLGLHPPPLVLDEVQYAPELLAALKRKVDRDLHDEKLPGKAQLARSKGGAGPAADRGQARESTGVQVRYVLTGSQQLQVLSKVRESLAGRAMLFDLWPMSRGELAGDLKGGLLPPLLGTRNAKEAQALCQSLKSAGRPPCRGEPLLERIFRGGYPGLLHFETGDVPAWMHAYLGTYVERDVRVLRDLSSPHDFTRFVRLLAALTAQEVNYSHLGREIGITPRSATGWLEVLVASFQVIRMDAYSGNTVKRVSGRPKMHLTDTGLACHLLHLSSPEALGSHPALGALFESYVVTELLKQAEAEDVRPMTWHFRTSGGAEVDLILERDGVFHPVEVKLSSRPSLRDLGGLRSFRATYPRLKVGPGVVVHGGDDLYLIDAETIAVPVDFV